MRTNYLALTLAALAGCASAASLPNDGPHIDMSGPLQVPHDLAFNAPDGGMPPTGLDAGTPPPSGLTTTIRLHYPAGAHTVTVRGSAAPMSWTADSATTSGATNTQLFTTTALTGSGEWKPLLDSKMWALGPNYHVTGGQTLDVYPRFTAAKGQVKTLISAFKSTVLNNTRTIYAYLPASYDENTAATYPVVYMHDGQNLWAALPNLAFQKGVTWEVDTAFDNAAATGTCSAPGAGGLVGWGAQPLGGAPVTCNGDGDCKNGGSCQSFPEAIVIGVSNTSGRFYEYTPTSDPAEKQYDPEGGADQYIKMLITELKPTIDSMLRTRPGVESTAMVGSSLGGLVTAYTGTTRPDVFGLCGVISPSTFWASNAGVADVIVTDVKGSPAAPKRPLKVYVDSGAGDADDEVDTDMLASAYLGLGYVDGVNFRHVVQTGASHGEAYWAQRFPGAVQLLLGVR